jgi:sulfide dehydrogenase cytochrome subunit
MRYTKGSVFMAACLCAGALVFATASSTVAATDISSLAAQCEGCHGKNGASQVPQFPIIGGLSALYISDAMAAFRDKTRLCMGETMCQIAKSLSEADAERLADYFAAKPFVRAAQTFDAALAERGKAIYERHCSKCHQDGGSLAEDDAGIMAGQWKPYLEEQFKEYISGKRLMPEKMKPKIAQLNADDINALIQYFASFQQSVIGTKQAQQRQTHGHEQQCERALTDKC